MTLLRKPSELRLAIVLLAAGEGSRMGSIPKALLLKDGISLLERFCEAIKALCPVEFVVISGFHAQAVEAQLELANKSTAMPITLVRNPNPANGQMSSVRLALESIQSDFDVLAVCLCDQPNVGVEQFQQLLFEFASLPLDKEIVLPMVNGQRGNPVLFSRKVVDSILSKPDMVCRTFMDRNPELVQSYETEDLAFILDVDTETDIQKMGVTRN